MRVAPLRIAFTVALILAVLSFAGCSKDTDPVSLFESGDYDESLSRFKQLAAAGDVDAKNYLGVHYYVGAAVERDFLAAAHWFETAALEGHTGAQKNLGMMYFRGLGVEQDNRRAFGWLYHARQSGNEDAQKYLRQMQTKVTPNASVIAVELISKQLAKKEALINVPR
jgi:TPR repeat protein